MRGHGASLALSKVRAHWASGGMSGLYEAVRDRAFSSGRFIRLRIDLDRHEIQPVARVGVAGCRVSPVELRQMRADWPFRRQIPSEFYLDITHRCTDAYVGYADDKVAGVIWPRYGGTRMIELPPDEVEITHVLTLPEYRGRGVFAAMLEAGLIDLRARGVKVAWAHVAPWNTPSLRGFRRAGAKGVGEVSIRFFFGVPMRHFSPELLEGG